MILLSFLNYSSSSKKLRFLKYHLTAVITFALLYWFQDNLMSNYPILMKNIGMGETDPPADSIYYWLWFSLVTQTTVGYGAPEDIHGKTHGYNSISNNILKILNIMQLLSIVFITAELF